MHCITLMKAWLYYKVLYQSSVKCISPISTQCYVFSPMPQKAIIVNSNWVSISTSLKLFKTIEGEVPWSKTNITFGQQMSNPKLNIVKQNLKTQSSTKLSIAKLLVQKTMGSMGEKKEKSCFSLFLFKITSYFFIGKWFFFFLVKGFASSTFSWVTPLVLLCIKKESMLLRVEWYKTKCLMGHHPFHVQ